MLGTGHSTGGLRTGSHVLRATADGRRASVRVFNFGPIIFLSLVLLAIGVRAVLYRQVLSAPS